MIGTISVRIEWEKKRKSACVSWWIGIVESLYNVECTLKINMNASNEHSFRMFRRKTFLFLQFIFRFRTFDSILSHDWPQSKIITKPVETFIFKHFPRIPIFYPFAYLLAEKYIYLWRWWDKFENTKVFQRIS